MPILTVVIGEGGSGGALAIAVSDRVLMFENSVYSVISPEGCAAILWRDGKKAPQAAEALKLTAPDLERLGIIDEMLPEPLGGAHRDPAAAAAHAARRRFSGTWTRSPGVSRESGHRAPAGTLSAHGRLSRRLNRPALDRPKARP